MSAVTNMSELPEEIAYKSRRWPSSIDVTVASGEVHWCCRRFGNEWRERVPIRMLVPCPTRCSTWTELKTSAMVSLIAIGVAVLTVWLHGLTAATIAACVACVILVLCAVTFALHRGPTEWVTFGTLLPEKSIYFYRTPFDDQFETFVDHLDASIAKQSPFGALGGCGVEMCEQSHAPEPAAELDASGELLPPAR